MVALELTGSDLDNFSCPECGAHDRERHLYLFLTRLGIWEKFKSWNILHFAPEKRLSRLIKEIDPLGYIRVDLFPTEPDIQKLDMLNISFQENSFDLIVANHVLEHVADDRKALAELYRVLKPGGIAILQTPFSSKLKVTFQDEGIDTDYARLHAYGQEDHVRLYGADIFSRFAQYGFRADIHTHSTTLGDIDPVRFGVNPREPLFLFWKS